MNDNEFCYWLKGAIEMNPFDSFDATKTQIIKNNLNSVFTFNKTPNAFCNFLNGYLTLVNPETITKEVIENIIPRLNNFAKTASVLDKVEQFTKQATAQSGDVRLNC